MTLSDKGIMQSFADNPEVGFKMLMDLYNRRLYYYIRRFTLCHEDTDDVLQNTLLKVWQNWDKFKADSSLYTWLYRIATNEALQFLRKREKEVKMLKIDGMEVEALLRSDSYFDGNAIQIKLYKAVATLPKQQRIIFNLRYFEDLPHQEIANLLELSVGSVKASYHIAVQKIEKYLVSVDSSVQ